MSAAAATYLATARRKLRAARALVAQDLPEDAAAAAYFAMLSAARAGLADAGLYPKTHRGTWHLFSDSFVKTGRIETEQYKATQRAAALREAADYTGKGANTHEAEQAIGDAASFVAHVSDALDLESEHPA